MGTTKCARNQIDDVREMVMVIGTRRGMAAVEWTEQVTIE